MKRLSLALLVLAAFVGTSFAASVFQLDVCNKHRTVSEAPGTSLTITQDGLCVLTSQVLAAPAGRNCGASKSSTAVVVRFPCKEEARLKQDATGPALNVWGSFEGAPQPSKAGMIVNEAAPAQRQAMQASKTANGISTARNNGCSFLTVNPGLYFHKSPPMFTYGYVVSGVPCEAAASALAVTSALQRSGGRTFPTTYSLWLKPTLPSPPEGMSTEPQSCNLVVSVLNRSYVSNDKFPCNMKALVAEELQEGCCYNAGTSGRHLLSRWELAMSYRRAFLH